MLCTVTDDSFRSNMLGKAGTRMPIACKLTFASLPELSLTREYLARYKRMIYDLMLTHCSISLVNSNPDAFMDSTSLSFLDTIPDTPMVDDPSTVAPMDFGELPGPTPNL